MITIKEKKNCAGCTACYSICPKNCIEMKEDNEGFKYPVVDKNKCIECNLCEKVCPIFNSKEEKCKQKGYIINNKNDEIRKNSTAGGFYTVISEYVIENGGIVFGAALDSNFNVVHEFATTKEELSKFRGSKYVQSELGDNFNKAKQFLEEGRLVCFSGLPCQIEGLKKYLTKDYENLITVDLMCHSVPSPLVWKKYLKHIKLKKLKGENIEWVSFRDKQNYGYQYSLMTVKSKNYKHSEGSESDPFLRAFLSDLSVRPSCYDCKFKKQYHVSDFTIWDCYIVEKFDKSFDDGLGTTRVLINTRNGNKVFEDIKEKFKYKEIEVEELVKNVTEMRNSVKMNPKRDEFFKDIHNMSEEEFFDKKFPMSAKIIVQRTGRKVFIKIGLYKKVKSILKKIIKRR